MDDNLFWSAEDSTNGGVHLKYERALTRHAKSQMSETGHFRAAVSVTVFVIHTTDFEPRFLSSLRCDIFHVTFWAGTCVDLVSLR